MYQDNLIKENNINDNKTKDNRHHIKFPPQLLQFLADIVTLSLAYFIYYYIRFHSGLFSNAVDFEFAQAIITDFVMLAYWLLIFWAIGLYKNWYIRSPFDEFFTLFKVIFFGMLAIVFLVFLDTAKSPRMIFLIYFAVMLSLIGFGRIFVRILQKRLRVKGIIEIPCLIIGTEKKAIDLSVQIKSAKAWGYKTIGFVYSTQDNNNLSVNDCLSNDESIPVLGNYTNLDQILETVKVHEVIIASDEPAHETLLHIVSECTDRGILVKIVPDLYDVFTGQTRTLPIYGIPLIAVSTQLLKPWEEVIKRIIDVSFSSLVLIVGSPLWLLFGILVKLDSKGPMFFIQERIGKNGKPFKMYKFRSMVVNAEAGGPTWTKVGDKRVTKFGKFIRKSHLDEVPQFWNVLLGDMSLVGPRPELSFFVKKYSEILPYYKRRLLVRPGITGWWQINYGPYVENVDEIKSRLKDDFYYIENISIKLDIEILIRTIYVVLKGHGQA